LLGKKKVRRNYYKNSRAQRREHFLARCFLGAKVVLLFAGFAATSLLLILAYDAVTQSPYFEARKITVEGNIRLSREAILKPTGLKPEDNILSLNVRTICSKILTNPWIAGAEVKRELPDAIHIQVKEHVPLAILDLDEPRYISDEGRIFAAAVAPGQAALPVVTGVGSGLDLSDPWRSPLFRAVMEALRLNRLHTEVAAFHGLRQIHADPEMGLTLHVSFPEPSTCVPTGLTMESGPSLKKISSPVAIKIGMGEYGSKYDRLRQVVSHLSKEGRPLGLQSIDLNDVDRVVVRLSPAGLAEKQSVVHRGGGWKSSGKEV
jgi:cell division septal protein FtsQ